MGQFIVEIDAVGNHGCDREALEGETVKFGCGFSYCADCQIADFVNKLKASGGANIKSAILTHWPNTPNSVIDDLLTSKRVLGQFKPKTTI